MRLGVATGRYRYQAIGISLVIFFIDYRLHQLSIGRPIIQYGDPYRSL